MASTSLELDAVLRERLIAEAEAEDRTVSAFLGELLREHVSRKQQSREYDAWFDAEIEQALAEADDPSIRKTPNEVVRNNLLRRIASPQDRG